MASPALKKVLITGAGTGFGHEAAMRLAGKGFDVIAGVEIYAQVQTLKRQAADRGVALQVEKLDVTNDGDRRRALDWGVEILVNNAGVGEGGSTVDIPASNIRHQFEVNVTGPLLLTQPIAKQMIKRGAGRIVWVSSREGLNVNPFTGIYSASKHAVEAIAETMADELREYNIEVATVNPGPFLTGFNDRMFQTWESWEDDPSQRLFDYAKLAFPRAQFDPEAVYATLTAVAAGEVDSYRNLEPKSMLKETEHLQQIPWQRKVTDGLGTRLHHHNANQGEKFEESHTGLDHVSFQVADRAALEAWIDRLDELNIGHTGIRRRPNGPYATVVFRDPDNNQLEFAASMATDAE